jgi:parallel beta-helix repeat protein
MKRLIFGLVLIVLSVAILTPPCKIQRVKGASTTIIVPDDYPTIQAAVNAASDGDTIFVRNGSYYENVVLNKTVTLFGENRETTVIDANQRGDCLDVTASGVTVTGFTLQNGGSHYSCVDVSSNYNSIVGNDLTGGWCGVSLAYGSEGEIIEDNVIANNLDGIVGDSLNGVIIIGNDVENNMWGVSIGTYSSHCIVSFNNLSYSWTQGLYAYAPSYCTFEGNNITNNNQAGWGEGLSLLFQPPYSYGNQFFHNNVANIGKEIDLEFSTPDQLTLDNGYPSGGNYWSDYNGTDHYSGPYQNVTGSDGIGDTPYVIDANNMDHYPLMNPYFGPIQPPPAPQTVYINSDGSVSPSDAPISISTFDSNTYYFMNDMSPPFFNGVVIERSNIVVDGNGYTVQGENQSGNGLSLMNVNNVTVTEANVQNFQNGIYLLNSNSSTIWDDTTISDSEDGIYLYSSSSNTLIVDNATLNGGGIYMNGGTGNAIIWNTATANMGDGITIRSSSSDTVKGNTATANNGSGFCIASSSDISFFGNTATANMDGISIAASDNNVSSNDVSGNIRDGIYLVSSSDNIVSGNNVTANGYHGIHLDGSSDGNTIDGNNVTANFEGLCLQSSSTNTVYHNDFVSNLIQASVLFPTSVGNAWDNGYPAGGNYWSDYNGTDVCHGIYENLTGSDGLGDTPYIIDANDVDSYPLMQPFSTSSMPTGYLLAAITANCTWVYEGQIAYINVTVVNFGDSPENIFVTLYSSITADKSISAYPVLVNNQQSYTLLFRWDTSGVPCLNYTLTAIATVTTGSSTLSGASMDVRLVGDVNGDGRVDMKDIAIVARSFGSTPGSPNWNPAADLNGDGKVNMKDIAIVARSFGQGCP